MAEELFTVTFTESQRRQVVLALDARRDYFKRSGLSKVYFKMQPAEREELLAAQQSTAEARRMVAECEPGDHDHSDRIDPSDIDGG